MKRFRSLFLVIFFFTSTSTVVRAGSPVTFAESLHRAEQVAIAIYQEPAPEGGLYRVTEWYNEGRIDSCSLPLPETALNPGDTVLICITPRLQSMAARNAMKTTYALPLEQDPFDDIVFYDEVSSYDYQSLINSRYLGEDDYRENLLTIAQVMPGVWNDTEGAVNPDGAWESAVAEALYWRIMVQDWIDNPKTMRTIPHLLTLNLSDNLKQALLQFLVNHPNPEILGVIDSTLTEMAASEEELARAMYPGLLSTIRAWNGDTAQRVYMDHWFSLFRQQHPATWELQPHWDTLSDSVTLEYTVDLIQVRDSLLVGLERAPVNRYITLLEMSVALPPRDTQICLLRAIDALSQIHTYDQSSRIPQRLSAPLSNLAQHIGPRSVPLLLSMFRNEQLRRNRIAGAALDALAGLDMNETAMELEQLFEQGVMRRQILQAMAGMETERGWRFALNVASEEVEEIFILGDAADETAILRFESGGAMNVLAERSGEHPEMERLLLDFYHRAPDALHLYAVDFLFNMPTDSAAIYLLSELLDYPANRFSTHLRVLHNMSPAYRAPFLENIVKGVPMLPAWEERVTGYRQSAFSELLTDTSVYATAALTSLALTSPGEIAAAALQGLTRREAVISTDTLALMVFSPRLGWYPGSVAIARYALEDDSLATAVFAQVGASMIEQILAEDPSAYSPEQITETSRILAELDDPTPYEALLHAISRHSNNMQAILWARYGLGRISG